MHVFDEVKLVSYVYDRYHIILYKVFIYSKMFTRH